MFLSFVGYFNLDNLTFKAASEQQWLELYSENNLDFQKQKTLQWLLLHSFVAVVEDAKMKSSISLSVL